MGAEFLHSINSTARTECGFATIDNVIDGKRANRMESFFLAETLKYLYLLFDPDHWLNKNHYNSEILYVENVGECQLNSGQC
jgi:mannosidase alpha-like ER degradation enhancer 2